MKGRELAHHHYNQALFGQAHILSHEIITDNLELVRTIREGEVIENTKSDWTLTGQLNHCRTKHDCPTFVKILSMSEKKMTYFSLTIVLFGKN